MRDPIGPQIERLFEDQARPVTIDELDPAVVLNAPPAIGKRVTLVAALGLLATVLVFAVLNSRPAEDPVVSPDQTDWDAVEFPHGMPSANELAVWTGEEIVFWGGQDNTVDSAPTGEPGIAYNPDTKQWRTLPPSGKKPTIGPAGVWTGEEVIICCGGGEQFADFAQTVAYNPSTDSWRSLADAPISGTYSEAVWTGTQMLVVASNGVAAYHPGTDSWSTFPEPPDEVTSESVYQIPWRISQIIWTGEELIGWSREVERVAHRGFALNPTTGEWRLLPEPPAWPAAPDMVWTGDKLILWGGLPARSGGSERAVGSVYEPETDSWTAMSEPLPEPEPFEGNLGSQSMVWTGDVALISTGAFGTGVDPLNPVLLTYDPDNDTWEHIAETVLPSSAWPQDLIIAGDRVVYRADKLYISPPSWTPRGEPATADSWNVTTTTSTTTTIPPTGEAPPGWTLTQVPFTMREGSAYGTGGGWFFAWGGAADRSADVSADGLLVDVETGTSTVVPNAPIKPRFAAATVWTGDEFIVFGGHSFSESFVDAAAYNPVSGQWRQLAPAPLSPAAAPSAVWTGFEMAVWLAGEDSKYAESPSPSVGQIGYFNPATNEWRVGIRPEMAVVDAELAIHDSQLVLAGGPGMRDARGGPDHILAASWFDESSGSWSEPTIGPSVESARLTTLPDGRLGALTTRGAIYAVGGEGWEVFDIDSPINTETEQRCWWDLGATSAGGETYLKICGYDLRFDGITQLVTIVEPDDYGATINLLGSAFLADDSGRLLILGDSPPPPSLAIPNTVFGVYDPVRP